MAQEKNAAVEPVWHRVLAPDELPEGRVKPVTCDRATVCMTHNEGRYAALDNRCPHQGGPLGEGSIENGLLRCPWHGWDFDGRSGRLLGYSLCCRCPLPIKLLINLTSRRGKLFRFFFHTLGEGLFFANLE